MPGSRRDFLSRPLGQDGSGKDRPLQDFSQSVPVAGATVHVATTAMACEFAVIMNAGSHQQAHSVSEALQVCANIEDWLSRYRPESDLSKVNQNGWQEAVKVCPSLFQLLQQALKFYDQTEGAFDIASGSLMELWRRCRSENRIPDESERESVVQASGSSFVELNEETSSVKLNSDSVQLDPGAIGKGFALDEARRWMNILPDTPQDFMIHGGHSSLIAVGAHDDLGGWPVGIGNPLLTQKRLGTLLLKDRSMSTSGSNIQFFRHEGKRYGHILDPRTGRPVQESLSVTVVAESAMLADVLSTAFYVLGPSNSLKILDRFPNVGVIFVPPPEKGTKIRPIVEGIDSELLFWDNEQVV